MPDPGRWRNPADPYGIVGMFSLMGAVSSVALSHEPDCTCDVCKASHGDQAAWERVAAAFANHKNKER